MCFSASASFGSSIILGAIGIASIKKVKEQSQYVFASVPLVFAIQQFSEGLLWLALTNPIYASLQTITTNIFLFFAQVVWPTAVPLAILMLEKEKRRKKFLTPLLGIGILVSSYLAFCLVAYPVQGRVLGYHISYQLDYPMALRRFGGVLYFVATIFPPFFSGVKRIWSLGLAILISYIITEIFYEDYIISVWCFFAAVISGVIYVVMLEVVKGEAKEIVKVTGNVS